MRDLQLDMPHDYVLPKLLEIYKLEKEYGVDENEGWRVLAGDRFVGELAFTNGKLSSATVRIYAGQDVRGLLDAFFTSVYDNSGNPTIKEGPGGNLFRSRTALVETEAREITSSLAGTTERTRMLFFSVGKREFRITSGTQAGGGPGAWLDEVIFKVWTNGATQKKTP